MYLIKLLFGLIIVDFVANSSDNVSVPLKLKRHYLKKFYLPATIQLLSHINDNLKFVLRPFAAQAASSGTVSSSSSSSLSSFVSALSNDRGHQTSTHRPGIVSPFQLADDDSHDEQKSQSQSQRIDFKNITSTNNYAKIIFNLKELENQQLRASGENNLDVDVNGVRDGDGDEDGDDEEFDTVLKFLASFDDLPDDANFMRKNRQNSLVRAYVTLVSLFDMLTKESRRNSLQKSQGYSDDSLRQLNRLAEADTSLEQLETMLRKLLEMDEIKSKNLMMKIAKIIQELNNNNSQNYLSLSIRTIPPLKFTP